MNRGWSFDPQFKRGDPYSSERPYWLDLSGCNLDPTVAARGYLLLNSMAGWVSLPRALTFKHLAKDEIDPMLSGKIGKDWQERDLLLFTSDFRGAGEAAEAKSGKEKSQWQIWGEMVTGQDVTATRIGNAGSEAVLYQHILHLKDTARAFAGDPMMAESYKVAMNGRTDGLLEFPLIYLANRVGSGNGQEWQAEFLGDGSHCSYATLSFDEKSKRGRIERFEASHAFDLDADGRVDILEINQRFAYWLESGKKPLVIDYGQGC